MARLNQCFPEKARHTITFRRVNTNTSARKFVKQKKMNDVEGGRQEMLNGEVQRRVRENPARQRERRTNKRPANKWRLCEQQTHLVVELFRAVVPVLMRLRPAGSRVL